MARSIYYIHLCCFLLSEFTGFYIMNNCFFTSLYGYVYSRLRSPALRHYPDKNFVVRCNLFVLQKMALWISSCLTQLVSTVALTLTTRSSLLHLLICTQYSLTYTHTHARMHTSSLAPSLYIVLFFSFFLPSCF